MYGGAGRGSITAKSFEVRAPTIVLARETAWADRYGGSPSAVHLGVGICLTMLSIPTAVGESSICYRRRQDPPRAGRARQDSLVISRNLSVHDHVLANFGHLEESIVAVQQPTKRALWRLCTSCSRELHEHVELQLACLCKDGSRACGGPWAPG